MSEKDYTNLINSVPEYRDVLIAIFNWFEEHPEKKELNISDIIEKLYDIPTEIITRAIHYLDETEDFRRAYRLENEERIAIGGVYDNIDDIPKKVEGRYAEPIDAVSLLPIPVIIRD
jgi:hypothetical protein